MGTTAFDPFVALGGYYQSLVLYHFFRAGVFDLLTSPRTAEFASKRAGWRAKEVRHCLEFLQSTTGLVKRDGSGRYGLTVSEGELRWLRFQVMKFTGAYGPTAARLDRALEGPSNGRALVDRRALAEAFSGVKDVPRSWVVPMMLGAGVTSLVDLGCGTGSLLIELARIDQRFHGTGIEADRYMCKSARAAVRAQGVARRVRIVYGDGRDVGALPDGGAIHAASLLNEMFANGAEEAAGFLMRLKQRYPGRDCWFVDYYGELGYGPQAARGIKKVTHAVLHDLIQALSGQGVPPPDLKSWRAIYRRAGVRLVESHEFDGQGLTWFVHRVRL